MPNVPPSMLVADFRNESLAEQVARHLAKAIRAGRWKTTLPGLRSLATEFDVSVPTLRRALDSLEAQGWLAPATPGKNRTIVSGKRAATEIASPGLQGKAVVYLLPSDAGSLDHEVQRQTARGIGRLGGQTILVATEAQYASNPGRVLETLLTKYEPDLWVVACGSEPIARWFEERSLRAVFVNGNTGAANVASVQCDLRLRIRQALQHLASLKHQRIAAIFNPIWQGRRADTQASLFHEEWEAVSLQASSYHTHALNNQEPGALHKVLDGLFSVTPPSALLVTDSAYATACLTYLQAKGLRVPRDVSLICLEEDRHFSWTSPPLAHFQVNPKHLSKPIVQHLHSLTSEALLNVETHQVSGVFISAMSTARARF